MKKYPTRKATSEGRAETLRRKKARKNKYTSPTLATDREERAR